MGGFQRLILECYPVLLGRLASMNVEVTSEKLTLQKKGNKGPKIGLSGIDLY
jgi:hypothetical protein